MRCYELFPAQYFAYCSHNTYSEPVEKRMLYHNSHVILPNEILEEAFCR